MIESLVAVDDYLLMIYYSPKRCYQFLVVDEEGKVHQFQEIFYTVAAAKAEGMAAIMAMSW